MAEEEFLRDDGPLSADEGGGGEQPGVELAVLAPGREFEDIDDHLSGNAGDGYWGRRDKRDLGT